MGRDFINLKQPVADAAHFTHWHPTAAISPIMDTSEVSVGAVHQQKINGFWQPHGFFSRVLKPAKTLHSAFGRELTLLVHQTLSWTTTDWQKPKRQIQKFKKPYCPRIPFNSLPSTFISAVFTRIIERCDEDLRHVLDSAPWPTPEELCLSNQA